MVTLHQVNPVAPVDSFASNRGESPVYKQQDKFHIEQGQIFVVKKGDLLYNISAGVLYIRNPWVRFGDPKSSCIPKKKLGKFDIFSISEVG